MGVPQTVRAVGTASFDYYAFERRSRQTLAESESERVANTHVPAYPGTLGRSGCPRTSPHSLPPSQGSSSSVSPGTPLKCLAVLRSPLRPKMTLKSWKMVDRKSWQAKKPGVGLGPQFGCLRAQLRPLKREIGSRMYLFAFHERAPPEEERWCPQIPSPSALFSQR